MLIEPNTRIIAPGPTQGRFDALYVPASISCSLATRRDKSSSIENCGFEIGRNKVGREPRPDDLGADAHHVDVVVLHRLVRRMDVVAHRSADAFHLVGGDRCADAGAADHDAALDLADSDLPGHLARDVRESRPACRHRLPTSTTSMAELVDVVDDGSLERPTRVVRADDESHANFLSVECGVDRLGRYARPAADQLRLRRQVAAVVLLVDGVELAVLQVGCDPFVELGNQARLALLDADREVEVADRRSSARTGAAGSSD